MPNKHAVHVRARARVPAADIGVEGRPAQKNEAHIGHSGHVPRGHDPVFVFRRRGVGDPFDDGCLQAVAVERQAFAGSSQRGLHAEREDNTEHISHWAQLSTDTWAGPCAARGSRPSFRVSIFWSSGVAGFLVLNNTGSVLLVRVWYQLQHRSTLTG